MKNVKKFIYFLVAFMMFLSICIPTFVLGSTADSGSITVEGALKGNTFTIYKVFDLESYNTTTKSYVYTISKDNPLYSVIENMKISDKKVFALTNKDANTSFVQLAPDFVNIQDSGAEVKTIASNLLAAIKELNETNQNKLLKAKIDKLGETDEAKTPTDKITTTLVAGDEKKYDITFSNLGLGYYLIDSSAGSMIGLTTTNPNATIKAKNELPKVEKEVKRNVDNKWGEFSSKAIGETVDYRVNVAVKPGATNYIIYDMLSEGLTYTGISKIYYGYSTDVPNEFVVYDANSTDKNDMTPYIEEYKTEGVEHNGKACCFKIKFKDSFLQTVLNGTNNAGYTKSIYVEYTAKLNENAVIAGEGNSNEIHMTYGDNNVEVSQDVVKTYTYQMELVKTTEDKTILAGAEFEVYATKDNTTDALSNKLSFVKSTEDGKTVYRVATADEIADANVETVTTIQAGDVIIKGLGGNFSTSTEAEGRGYWFKETKAPEGYTMIPSPIEYRIKDTNEMSTIENGKWVEGGLRIENKSGFQLPSTGGIGTTILYIIGSILLVGAVVLLVIKKKKAPKK